MEFLGYRMDRIDFNGSCEEDEFDEKNYECPCSSCGNDTGYECELGMGSQCYYGPYVDSCYEWIPKDGHDDY